MSSQMPAYGSDRDQGHEHPRRRRRGTHRTGERGDDAEGEEQREQPEGRHERRPRRRGTGVAPEEAMRADQRAEKAPRRVHEKRNAHEKRVPAPRSRWRHSRPSSSRDRPAPPISAASWGLSDPASAAKPSPATATSIAGRSQMKSRYASAPAMIPPPVSTSRSTTSNTTSTDSWRFALPRRARRSPGARAWIASRLDGAASPGSAESSSCGCVSSAGSTMPRPPRGDRSPPRPGAPATWHGRPTCCAAMATGGPRGSSRDLPSADGLARAARDEVEPVRPLERERVAGARARRRGRSAAGSSARTARRRCRTGRRRPRRAGRSFGPTSSSPSRRQIGELPSQQPPDWRSISGPCALAQPLDRSRAPRRWRVTCSRPASRPPRRARAASGRS